LPSALRHWSVIGSNTALKRQQRRLSIEQAVFSS
jgi:hypothetical protein